MRLRAVIAGCLAAAAGCGAGNVFEGETSVPLDKVPAPVMEAAKKALPGVTFTRAATLMSSTDDRERLAHATLQAADTLSTHQHPTGGHHG